MKHRLLTATLLSLSFMSTATAAVPDNFTVTPDNGATVSDLTTISVYNRLGYMEPYVVNRYISINGKHHTFKAKASGQMDETLTFTLDEPIVQSGDYEILIPAATFTYGWDETDNTEMSWKVSVNNPEHPAVSGVDAVVNPESGTTVTELSSLTFEFADATAVSVTDAPAIVVNGPSGAIDVATSFSQEPATPAKVTMTLTPAITANGSYTVSVPAGTFTVTTDGKEFPNNAMTLSYTIKGLPQTGEKIKAGDLYYHILSAEDRTLSVTWPENESEYNGITAVPDKVTYQGLEYTVIEIGKLAFSEVKGLTTMTVPETVTTLGEAAFWDSSIKEISLPATLATISDSAFEDCQSLSIITIPASVTTLGESIFSGCTSIENIDIKAPLEAIPANFAAGCQSLKKFVIPAGVRTIGEFAFSECAALADTALPEGVTTLERFCFAYTQALDYLAVPESVTTLGHGVFYQSALSRASLPDAITVIPDGTYQCCALLKEFEVSDAVTEIEKEAFYWCFDLEKITLGESVKTLGDKVFYGDKALKEVICKGAVPPAGAVFEQDVYDNATLYVPEAALEAYKSADGWKEFSKIVGVQSGISAIDADDSFAIASDGNTLTIATDTLVDIFSADGRRIYHGSSTIITLSAGLYLVSDGTRSVKVIL